MTNVVDFPKPPKFTPKAEEFWSDMPVEAQNMFLKNVYCGTCGGGGKIKNFTGRIERADLILQGFCTVCDGPVGRLIEGS